MTGLAPTDTAALPVLARTIDQRAEKLLAAEPAPGEVKQLEKAPEDHQDLV
ncbi:hypothetical protein AB0N07_23075 [Streptomyces sp. NPDC051172]|uniref:hypothetical protein n=1 Tax=Streptomyces sp. NPDC051172 TaxID=3155796 RepID=UPI0034303E3E